eukprot:5434768-Prymnesium_polylepis.1
MCIRDRWDTGQPPKKLGFVLAPKCGAWDIATRRQLAHPLVLCWVRRPRFGWKKPILPSRLASAWHRAHRHRLPPRRIPE